MCRSFHRASKPVRCRIRSVHHHHHPPPGDNLRFFFPAETAGQSVRNAAACRRRSSRRRDDNTGERQRLQRETSSEPGLGSAWRVGASMLERLFLRQTGLLQMSAGPAGREDAPTIRIPADQSRPCRRAGLRSHWPAALSGTTISVSSLNKEITQIHKCTLA